ncbi:hypothetical protein HYT01_03640 [Candidatus Giovannonibacteria bacterium]|nr:hypothetical protein [Candidatus Giovannonibacteria bacterium]
MINCFFLGVEGGGTKSRALLADEDGKIIRDRSGKALNYHAIGEKQTKANLKELIAPLLKASNGRGIKTVFGLAGLDTKQDWKIYDGIIKSLLPRNAKYKIVNDAAIALEAKCPVISKEAGIVAIAGTGANVYGRSRGKTIRSVGWDFLLGDEGGSFSAGLKAMHAAMRSWDGRMPKSVFEKSIPKAAGAKNIEGFYHKLYKVWREDPQNIKYYIASFSHLVDEAILKKDKAALVICDREVKNLSRGIEAVARRLKLSKKAFCVGFAGSGWKMPGLKDKVKKSIKKEFPGVYFSKNEDNSGVVGAIQLARAIH